MKQGSFIMSPFQVFRGISQVYLMILSWMGQYLCYYLEYLYPTLWDMSLFIVYISHFAVVKSQYGVAVTVLD